MAIAAVPDYLGKEFDTASPGLRFGMYLPIWQDNFSKEKEKFGTLSRVGRLNETDIESMKSLLVRQQAMFNTVAGNGSTSLQLDAISTSPFTTGLGNEHPTENGFAFLNPYGLPYLPGSGVKGVIRQAARELLTGDWGQSHLSNESFITALFGPETGSDSLVRGALSFWDVIPQIKGEGLVWEIMTPHQQHYYQKGRTPHDSGQPNPILFLAVPVGSGFTFHVQCNHAVLEQTAPALIENDKWKALVLSFFQHAFQWLGFGAKTAVGYGAMKVDTVKTAEREQLQVAQRERIRRESLSPEDQVYEDNCAVIDGFRSVFEQARQSPYQAGQAFDSRRNEFIHSAFTWDEPRSRRLAAELLAETVKWGISKKGKDRLKGAVSQLLEGCE